MFSFRGETAFCSCKRIFFPSVLSRQHASQVLVRRRRANSLLEETKKGNLKENALKNYAIKKKPGKSLKITPNGKNSSEKWSVIPEHIVTDGTFPFLFCSLVYLFKVNDCVYHSVGSIHPPVQETQEMRV